MFFREKILVVTIGLVFLLGMVKVTVASPPFGGNVEELFYCNCSNNWYVKVGSPRGGDFIKQDGVTEAYACEGLEEGDWILGMSTGETAECKVVVGKQCVVVHTGLMIDYYGTSPSDCLGNSSFDVSGDGEVTVKDALLVLKKVAGYPDSYLRNAGWNGNGDGDVDKDGEVTLRDVRYLLRLAGVN